MLVQVGNRLRINDEDPNGYLVTYIGESDYVELARDSSADWTPEERARQANCEYLSCSIEDYNVGDVIHIEEQRIRLERAGNIRFIVTRRRVRTIYANPNAAGAEDEPIEGTGIGSESGQGSGEKGVSQDNRPQDGD